MFHSALRMGWTSVSRVSAGFSRVQALRSARAQSAARGSSIRARSESINRDSEFKVTRYSAEVSDARSSRVDQRGFSIAATDHTSFSNGEQGDEKTFCVTFVLRDGSRQSVRAKSGENVMELAHANEIDLEGACEGSLACSTCHVYVDPEHFEKLPPPCEDENDMLDLAFALKKNSRLGCQIKIEKTVDGITVTLPPAIRSLAEDGD
mmetsp:Transcript_14255/g.38227  ORF Transcript_14255/g.38227 Transcript_14255/m.38227 type:complete len:207 (-) Transcript_14255:442-1062(-)